MRSLILLFMCLLPFISWAQETDTLGVERTVKKFNTTNDYLTDKVLKFVFTLDSRNSFVGNRYVVIDGIKAGLEYEDKLRFGIGYYGLISPLEKYYKLNGIPDTFHLVLHFWYASAFTEYVLFKNQKWEVSTPIQLAFGQTLGEKKSMRGVLLSSKKNSPSLLEVSVNGHYRIVKWIGVGGGVGYRFMFSKDESLRSYFDSPIVIYKVKLFLGEIYKSLFIKKPDK